MRSHSGHGDLRRAVFRSSSGVHAGHGAEFGHHEGGTVKPEFLQTASQVAIGFGLFVTALGGYGAYHFGKVVERVKDERSAEREAKLKVTLDTLVVGNNNLQSQLAPFKDIAARLYPGIESDAALGRLSREITEMKSRTSALERRTEPRRLTKEQATAIASVLRAYPSKTIDVVCTLGDTEAFQFATDLKMAVASGGWTANGIAQAVFSGPVQGLVIQVSVKPPPDEAQQLFEALGRAGLRSEGSLDPNSTHTALIIGTRE